MSNKFILKTLLMASLIGGMLGVSLPSANISKDNAYQPVVADVLAAKNNPDFSQAVELNSDELSISITNSSTTKSSQAYQVSFSSKITTFTTSDKNVYIRIDDPAYTKPDDYPSQDNEEDRPNFGASVYRIMSVSSQPGKGDIVVPRRLKYGSKFVMNVTAIGANAIDQQIAKNITSILIPETVDTIYESAFDGLDSSVVFNIMASEPTDTLNEAMFPDGATINWGYQPTAAEEIKLNGAVFGAPKDFGTGNSYMFGYKDPTGKNSRPLYIGYFIIEDGKRSEQQLLELPLTNTNKNNYDACGDSVGSVTFNKAIDIELLPGQEIDDEEIYFYNIYEAVKDENGAFVPNFDDEKAPYGYYSHAKCSYLFKNDISNYITYEYDSIVTFSGYTSVVIDVDTVPGIYERLKASSYEANIDSINSGYMVIRYRLTSFNLARYRITYELNGENVTVEVPIKTPVDSYYLSKQKNNKVNFLLKNSDVGEGFAPDKIRGLELVGLYFTLDLFVPDTNSIVTKSNTSTRFGIIEVLPLTDSAVDYMNINMILIISMVIYVALYSLITLSYFAYAKRKFRNDEFRRIKPKQFFKNAVTGLFGLGIIILSIMFIYFRFWPMNNSIIVYNQLDVFVIVFTIAAILAIGYYIRFFTIMIKTNIEKRKSEKLKLNEDVADDGTK